MFLIILGETVENLALDLEDYLDDGSDDQSSRRLASIRKSLKEALEVGQSLGILTMTDDNTTIRMPFNFRKHGDYVLSPELRSQNTSRNNAANDGDEAVYEENSQDDVVAPTTRRRKATQPKRVGNFLVWFS